MVPCPQCDNNDLNRVTAASGTWFVCSQCNGKAVPDSYVEENFIESDQTASGLMNNVQLSDDEHCPDCGSLLKLGTVPAGDSKKVVGRCDGCAIMWFPDELGRSISRPESSVTKSDEPDTSGDHSQPSGDESSNDNAYIKELRGWSMKGGWGDTPSNLIRWLPAFLGFPVKLYKTEGNPAGTWLLTIVLTVVFFLTSGNVEFIETLGFSPNHWYRWGGITAFTSFFLHAGLLHLIGNVYFFIVFGQDVEQALGTGRFLIMIFASALFGNVLFSILQWGTTIPSIGASGGVAGVLAYFALAYPKQRFGYAIVPIIIYPIWLRLRAYWGFMIWLFLQFYGAHSQMQGLSSVNALAHIGGVVVGIGFWLRLRER